MSDSSFSPTYGITRTLDCSFDDAGPRVREALKDQGFGVLTEIDIAATMKKKLDKSMRPYTILGACHPQSAWDALQVEPGIGLLLPCNVVVTEDDDGNAVISAVDPGAMFQVVEAEGMDEVANDVRERLNKAIAAA